jgi:uncharacterized protein YkwD
MSHDIACRGLLTIVLVLSAGCSDDVESAAPFGDIGEDGTGAGDEAGDEVGDEYGEGEGEGDGDGDGDEQPSTEMPDNAYCQPAASWDPYWVAHAEEVVALLNQARAAGGDCGAQGPFAPAPALIWNPALTCASRVHSGDMAEHDYVDHTNLEGKDAAWRYEQAGYTGEIWSENLGAGYASPAEAVQGWLGSEINCPNVYNSKYVEIGVGYAFRPETKYLNYWTLSLGG